MTPAKKKKLSSKNLILAIYYGLLGRHNQKIKKLKFRIIITVLVNQNIFKYSAFSLLRFTLLYFW
jgi:hypothetical protein